MFSGGHDYRGSSGEETVIRREISLKDNGLTLVQVDVETTPATKRILASMKECPHLVLMADAAEEPDRAICLYALPEEKIWWATMQTDNPAVIKAKSARVTVFSGAHPDIVSLPHHESRKEPPCRSDCPECPQYRTRCKGCPVSRHYLA